RGTSRAPWAGQFAERHGYIVAPAPPCFIPVRDPRPPGPAPEESAVLYELAKPVVMGVVRVLWRPTIAGVENIPERGAVILASNQLAYSDTVFLPGQVRRTVHFLGKSDIFAGRSPLNKVVARVMRGLEVMPVDRAGGDAAGSAIEAGLSVL